MYKIDEFNKLKSKFKLGIIISSVLFIVIAASLIVIGFNVNDDNATMMLIISLAILLVLGFVTIYLIIENIYLTRIRINFIKLVNQANKLVIKGVVVSCDKKVTTSKYHPSYLIEVEGNDSSRYTLYSEDKLDLKTNATYEFSVGNNYIVDYKEVVE